MTTTSLAPVQVAREAPGARAVPFFGAKTHSIVPYIFGFGLAARLYHYFRDPAVWMDELFLLRNIVSKDYRELIGPLTNAQAAPPLFLWIERAIFLLLGDSTLALRLVPLTLSVIALAMLLSLARRCLSPAAIPWAILLFATSDKVLDHTPEAKQYLMDVFVAIAVPLAYLSMKHWRLPSRLVVLSLLTPLVLFSSYPGCFAIGALFVAVLPDLWAERRSVSPWVCFGLWGGTTIATFYALLTGPIRAQHSPELAAMWADAFPDWGAPWTVPWWTLKAFADGVDHSFRPVGMVFAPAAVLGGIILWRRDKKEQVIVLALPILLGLLAAWLHACPYHSRVTLYTSGALALLGAEGSVAIMQHCRRLVHAERQMLGHTLAAIAVVLLLLPLGLAIVRIASPWPRQAYPWPETVTPQP